MLEEFPGIKVYQEQVEQGFEAPCFLVRTLKNGGTPLPETRHRRLNLFSVQYFPASKTDAQAECYGVCGSLFQALEFVGKNGSLARGTGIRGEISHIVLTFTVQYNAVIRAFLEIDLM